MNDDNAYDNITGVDGVDEGEINEALEVEAAPVPKCKKRPGRPKKNVVIAPIVIQGIKTAPSVQGHILELVYHNPALFSKLLRLYKQYEVSDVEMRFDLTGVRLCTTDHLGKSKIYATIEGSCMDLYYCKEPMRVCVKRSNIENVLDYLGKNHSKITILFRDSDFRSKMHMIIRDDEYNNDGQYEIDVEYKVEEAIVAPDDDSTYPVKFCFTTRHLKSKIAQIRKLSDTFMIQKTGVSPLQITCENPRGVSWTEVYADPAKISLISTITDEDAFTVSMFIDYVKPFANSSLGDHIHIAAHQTKNISFMTQLDHGNNGWACCVKIFTEIKTVRVG